MALHHLILKDFWLKLFSLVLAVLIWLTVSFAIQKESTVPLNLPGRIDAPTNSAPTPAKQ